MSPDSRRSKLYSGVGSCSAVLLTLFGVACSDDEGEQGASLIAPGEPCVQQVASDYPGDSGDTTSLQLRSTEYEGPGPVYLTIGFQGRSDCPYGNLEPPLPGECNVEDGILVPPQLVSRPPADAMYCTCRCAGPPGKDFCTCPETMYCTEQYRANGFDDDDEFAGSYCTKEPLGGELNPTDETPCSRELANCEDR